MMLESENEMGVHDVASTPPGNGVDAARRESDAQETKQQTPFEHEKDVVVDSVQQRDEISEAQSDAVAAAQLSGEHIKQLLYGPEQAYDPRSSPDGANTYPPSSDGNEE